MTARTRKVCGTCGSLNVVCDAWAEWDEVEQEWTLQNTFDQAFCEDCEGETSIEDQEIVDDPPCAGGASAECAAGLHSWIGSMCRLAPDTTCTHCGETYGDPK